MSDESTMSSSAAAPSAAPVQSSPQPSQAQQSQPAPEHSAAAAIRAKSSMGEGQTGGGVQPEQSGQAPSVEPEKGTQGAGQKGPEAGTPAAEAKQSVDDHALWLASKGLDVGDLAKDERVAKLAGMYRQLEGAHTKASQEVKRLQEEAKRAAAEVQAQATQQAEEPSPMDKLQQRYQSAVEGQCYALGCQSAAELAQRHPDMWQRIQAAYQDELVQAQREEVRWELGKRDREAAKKERESKLAADYQGVQRQMQSNILEAMKTDPNVKTNLATSGVAQFVADFGKRLNVPPEYVYAHPEYFKFLSEAANAIMTVRNLPKMRESWAAEYEANLRKSAQAQSVSPIDPMPKDARALIATKAQGVGRGVAF